MSAPEKPLKCGGGRVSVPKSDLPLFLKECEWRFNNLTPKSQLKQLKQLVKQYIG
jgi:transposase